MLVSVIIPVFNGEKYIAHALKSIYCQTYKNFEVICVDDGSTDSSAGIIRNFESVIYHYQENKGIPAARNIGIKLSQGELIALLNQDDLWLPDKLRLQVNYLLKHPEVAMVHSNINISKNEITISPKTSNNKRHKGIFIFDELYLGNFIFSLTVLVRRECLGVSGFFDEEIRLASDYDLWLRMAANFGIGYLDVVTGTYRLHSNNLSNNRLPCIKDDIKVLNKMDVMYPELVEKIPKEKRNNKRFHLNFLLGCQYLSQYNLFSARKYFFIALKYRKNWVPIYGYILLTYLSRDMIGRIKNIKRKVVSLRIEKGLARALEKYLY